MTKTLDVAVFPQLAEVLVADAPSRSVRPFINRAIRRGKNADIVGRRGFRPLRRANSALKVVLKLRVGARVGII